MMIRQCLDDAGRKLQLEVNKQLGVASTEQEEGTVPDPPRESHEEQTLNKFPAATMALSGGNAEDDAMIAAFLAKQAVSKQRRPQELPVREWALTIITHPKATEKQNMDLLNKKDQANQDLVDRLYKKFCSFQDSA